MLKSEYLAQVQAEMEFAKKEAERARHVFDHESEWIWQDRYESLKQLFDDLSPQETPESMAYAEEIVTNLYALKSQMTEVEAQIADLESNAKHKRIPNGEEQLQQARVLLGLLSKDFSTLLELYNKRPVEKEDFIEEELILDNDSNEEIGADSEQEQNPETDTQDNDALYH